MAGRVPEYFTNGLQSVIQAPRLSSNAPVVMAKSLTGVIGDAAGDAALLMLHEAKKEQKIAEDRALEETSLTVDKGLASLANKNRLDPEKFNSAAEEEKNKWLAEVPKERQEDYLLMFEKQKHRYSKTIENNRQRLEQEKQTATFLTAADKYYNEALKSSRRGDVKELQTNINAYMNVRQNLMDSGAVSAERYADMGIKFSDDIELQKYVGEFDAVKTQGTEKVQEYLNNFLKREDMPAPRRQRFANAILADYRTYQAGHALQSKELLEKANFVMKATAQGLEPQIDTAELLNGLENSGQFDAARKVRQSIELGKQTQEFVKLPFAAMKHEIETLQQKQQTPFDLAQLNAYQSVLKTAAAEISNDPLNFAISRKIVDDKPLNMANLKESAETRISNAKLVQQRYSLEELPLLTKAEADNFAMIIRSGDKRNNAALLGDLYEGFGEYSHAVINAIAPKVPQFAQAAALYQTNPQAALDVIEGVEIVKRQKEYTPASENEFNKVYYETIGNDSFLDTSPEWRDNLRQTVKARLAKLNLDKGKTDRQIEKSDIKTAIKDVIGDIAELEMDGSGWLWDSSFKAPAPQGKTADDLENWYMNLTDNDVAQAVTLSGHKVTIADIHTAGKLSFAGDGKYFVRINGQLLYLPTGKPFVLTYTDVE